MPAVLKGLRGLKLRYKLFLLILLQATVFFTVYGYTGMVLEKEMLQKLTEHNSALNYQNTSAVRAALAEVKNIFASTLRLENSEKVRETDTLIRQLNGYQDINLAFRGNAKLWSMAMVEHPYLRHMALASAQGPTVYIDGGSENFFLTVTDPGEAWMTQALRTRVDHHLQMEDGLLRLSRAVINPVRYEKQGVLTALCDLSFAQDNFEGQKLFANQSYGLYIGGVQAAGTLDLAPEEVRRIADAPTPTDSIFINRSADVIYLYYRQTAPDEIISITRIPYHAISGQTLRQNLGMIFLLLVWAAGSFALNTAVVHSVVKSLGVFERAFGQIERGRFGLTVDAKVERELQGFLESYNRMSLRLGELIHEVYERQLTEHQLELQMLRNQINPHFFYNTLEALRMNCLLGREADNVQMIEYLSIILRYGVSARNEPVSLWDELRHLGYYVELHNLRSDTCIRLRTAVPDEVMGAQSIRLLFQPILENAVYHGIARPGESLEVEILCYREGEDLVFTVSDNGGGMPEETAAEINRCLAGEAADARLGIGLRNIHRRLQLHFGKQYGLQVDSRPGRGTRVTITMPLRLAGGPDQGK